MEHRTDTVDLCVCSEVDPSARWLLRDRSAPALAAHSPYFDRLLYGWACESRALSRPSLGSQGAEDGETVRVVLPLHPRTPREAVEALFAFVEHPDAHGLDPAYVGLLRDALAFLDPEQTLLPRYERLIRSATEANGARRVDPALVLLAYALDHKTGLRLCHPAKEGGAFAFLRLHDTADPSDSLFDYALYGDRLALTARLLSFGPADALGPVMRVLAWTLCHMIPFTTQPAINHMDPQVRSMDPFHARVDSILAKALMDWRRSMLCQRPLADDREPGPVPILTWMTADPLLDPPKTRRPRAKRGRIAQRRVLVDPSKVSISDGTQEEKALFFIADMGAFRRNLCADFAIVAPLLFVRGDGVPPFPRCASAKVVLAGGSVVNAIQADDLRRQLNTADLDLWIVGSTVRDRMTMLCALVAWFFDVFCPPLYKCRVRIRDSVIDVWVISLEVPDARLGSSSSSSSSTSSSPLRGGREMGGEKVEKVQIIMTPHESIEAVVDGFDASHACAAYDGVKVDVWWPCMQALVTRHAVPLSQSFTPSTMRYDKAARKAFHPMWDRCDNTLPTHVCYNDDGVSDIEDTVGMDGAGKERYSWHTCASAALCLVQYKPIRSVVSGPRGCALSPALAFLPGVHRFDRRTFYARTFDVFDATSDRWSGAAVASQPVNLPERLNVVRWETSPIATPLYGDNQGMSIDAREYAGLCHACNVAFCKERSSEPPCWRRARTRCFTLSCVWTRTANGVESTQMHGEDTLAWTQIDSLLGDAILEGFSENPKAHVYMLGREGDSVDNHMGGTCDISCASQVRQLLAPCLEPLERDSGPTGGDDTEGISIDSEGNAGRVERFGIRILCDSKTLVQDGATGRPVCVADIQRDDIVWQLTGVVRVVGVVRDAGRLVPLIRACSLWVSLPDAATGLLPHPPTVPASCLIKE